jgi:hypothetical protein
LKLRPDDILWAAMRLDGGQYERLWTALLAAFDYDALERLFRFRLNKVLGHYVSRDRGDQAAFFRLIEVAEREDWLFALVLAARDSRPSNADLAVLAQEIGASSLRTDHESLERIVRRQNVFADVLEWRSRLAELEPRVCRIERRVGGKPEALGTGFLVGKNVLLTNHHVVRDVIAKTVAPEDIICRFDYRKARTGETSPGVELALADDWLVDSCPHGPGAEDLDYALLRLRGAPADAPIGERAEPGAAKRGFIPIPAEAHTFSEHDPLFILQHPAGEPLKLAIDTDAIVGVIDGGRRVRYTTNTEPGSSGSPCFDQSWNLVALHNRGDMSPSPKFNEGIPISRIHALLTKRGFADLLGG